MNLSPRFGCIVNQLVSGEVKAEAVCSSSGRAGGKIVDLSSGEEEWGLRNILHFDRVMQPEDTEGPARLKPVWHQFKTPLCHKNQTTHQRFESFHSVAVDTGLLPWWCYYRQLQFDRQMKSVKQQKYFINNFRERKRNGAASLQGWASPAQVYFTYLRFFFSFWGMK